MASHSADSDPTADELSIRAEANQSTQRRWTPAETLSLLECYSNRRDEYHNEEKVYQCILEDMKDLGVWNKPATVTDVSNKLQWMRKEYQNFVSSDGAYDMPQMLRPFIGQLKALYGTNEAVEMSQSNQEFKDKQTRRTWSRQETVALLDCIYKRRAQIAASNRKLKIYAKIGQHLDRLKLLIKPATAQNIEVKMRAMKKAYIRAINSNLQEIPRCVRPFMRILDSIYGDGTSNSSYQHSSEGIEAIDDDTMYDEQDVDESSTDNYTNSKNYNEPEDTEEFSMENERLTRRFWTVSETAALLQCYAKRKKEIDASQRKIKVYEKLVEDLARLDVLKKPVTAFNIDYKMVTMRKSYFYAINSGMHTVPKCVVPFMTQLQQLFDMHCELSDSNRSAEECVYVKSSDDETTSVAQEISSMDVPAQRPTTPTDISQPESSQNISNSKEAELANYQRRTWTKQETLGLLKCFMLHRKDYETNKGKAAVYQKILDALKRMNVLTKPINVANVQCKLKAMKKAYLRAHTLEEIPKCVRPFMKEMSKICRKDFVESRIVNDAYGASLRAQSSYFVQGTRIFDTNTGRLQYNKSSPRRWFSSEIREMLNCLMRHKLEYVRSTDKMMVCKRIHRDLAISRLLKKPTTTTMIKNKIQELRNDFLSNRIGRCQEPSTNIFDQELQEVFGQRYAQNDIPTMHTKESRVQEPTTRQHKSIPEETELSGSETPLVKLEFIKLEPVAGTIVCGEIHRCSETFVLSFVCTVCREYHTNLAAYSSHLSNHFGSMLVENDDDRHDNDDDRHDNDDDGDANEQELPEFMSETDQFDSVEEALPELKEIPSLLLGNSHTLQPSDADVDSKNTNSFATQSLMSLLYNQSPTTFLKPIDGSELLPSDYRRIKSDLHVSTKLIKSLSMSTKSSDLPVENETTQEVDFSCCNRCGQEFVSLSDYETHVKTEYAEDKMHICPYKSRGKVRNRCSTYNFPSNCLLTKHLLTIHGRYPKPFDCDVCKKSFKSPMSLQHHRTLHTGDRPYQCDICKKSFTLYHYLGIHMRFHTGEKPELCPACGRGFTTKSLLSLHMRTHNGDMKRYACSVCNQGFRYPGELAIHMRVHTGEKPFACKLCGKCYRSKRLVQQHERLHNPEKRHACRFCNLKFTQSSNRHLHERQKHNVATT